MQKAIDQAVSQGFKEIEGFEVTTLILLSAIALLTLLGTTYKKYSI